METPSSDRVFHSQVSQTGGVNFGQGNEVRVLGNVIGTQIVEGIAPEQMKAILAGIKSQPLPSYLHQLEPPPADFTGREEEFKELLTAADSGGVKVFGLFGMGGVGKTAFALKLAERLSPNYPDAQIYLNLRGTDPAPLTQDELLIQVLRSFYPQDKLPEGEGLLSLFRSTLHGKRVLLLMDNAQDAGQVERLVPPLGSILLVTSRQHFTLPGMKSVDLILLRLEDARVFALKIAPHLGETAMRLCESCDYLPLAIRVAASTLQERRDLSPADFVKQLADLGNRLELTGVEVSLRSSIDLLPPDLRERWCSVAVFPASFIKEAAGAVWDLESDPAHQVLSDLLRFSLLEFNPLKERYKLNPLARLLAGKLLGDDPRAAGQSKHAAHFLQVLWLANDLYSKGGEQTLAGLGLFDTEWQNIKAGHDWSVANALEDDFAAQLCKDFPDAGLYILDLRLNMKDEIDWLEAAISAARQMGDRRAVGVHQGNLGNAYYYLGEARRAIEYYEGALSISREGGDLRNEGAWLGNLGNSYQVLGEARRAIEYYEQALSIAREIGDRRNEGNMLGGLGIAYDKLGDVSHTIEYSEKALFIARETGDRRAEGLFLGNLGLAHSNLGDAHRAVEYYEQALTIAREIGDRLAEGIHLGNLGNAYVNLGETQRAIEYFEEALIVVREIGDRRNEALWLSNLGNAYQGLGEALRAIEVHEQALSIAREIGDQRGEGMYLGSLGIVYENLGEAPRAFEYYEQALAICREIGDRRGEANNSWNLGLVYESQGDLPAAIAAMQILVDYEQEIGHLKAKADAAYLARLRARNAKAQRAKENFFSSLFKKMRRTSK